MVLGGCGGGTPCFIFRTSTEFASTRRVARAEPARMRRQAANPPNYQQPNYQQPHACDALSPPAKLPTRTNPPRVEGTGESKGGLGSRSAAPLARPAARTPSLTPGSQPANPPARQPANLRRPAPTQPPAWTGLQGSGPGGTLTPPTHSQLGRGSRGKGLARYPTPIQSRRHPTHLLPAWARACPARGQSSARWRAADRWQTWSEQTQSALGAPWVEGGGWSTEGLGGRGEGKGGGEDGEEGALWSDVVGRGTQR